MSFGKCAAQCAHAVIGLGVTDYHLSVVCLSVSDAKFMKITERLHDSKEKHWVVRDAGFTEVSRGTPTCVAFYEEEEE